MSDIKFRDQGLRRTFAGMMNDNQITKAEVDKLIESTKDGPGLSKTERKDLQKLLTTRNHSLRLSLMDGAGVILPVVFAAQWFFQSSLILRWLPQLVCR